MKLLQLKKQINQSVSIETKEFKPKNPSNPGKKSTPNTESGGKIPEICRTCFEKYEYKVEAKDREGRWIFHDDNIFDDTPGQLDLTDRFWQEVEENQPTGKKPALLPAPQSKKLKNHIALGFELDRSKIEYSYSPLGLRKGNFEIGVSVYSALYLNYSFMPTSASAGRTKPDFNQATVIRVFVIN